MSVFDITTNIEQDYLRVTASGNYSLAGLFDLLARIKHEAEISGKDRVLVDARPLKGNMTEAERFQGGARIAELFGPRIKLAVVMPADTITGLGELTAANRGARFFVSSSEQEAIDWLVPHP